MDNVEKIRQLLNIDQYFPDLDLALLQLAITPTGTKLPPNVYKYLNQTQNLQPYYANYETLEFYGDTVLNMIVIDEFALFLKLNVTPQDLTEAKTHLVNNSTLTSFSRSLFVCNTVFKIRDNVKLAKHNICADTFESILGALYYQYGFDSLPIIKKWVLSLSVVREAIDVEINTLLTYIRRDEIGITYPKLVFSLKGNLVDFEREYVKRYPNFVFKVEPFDEGLSSYVLMNKVNRDTVILAIYDSDQPVEENYYAVKDALIDKKIWVGK